MDNPIHELDLATQSIMKHLAHTSYEDLEEFVDLRDSLLIAITTFFESHPISSDDKAVITSIMSCDELIYGRLIELKGEAADWLAQRNNAKSRRSAYENSYAMDSIVMDSKK